jgi:15-cis-phytoene desaturase
MAKVIILGAGMGGLAAAHELIERGYSVDIYEAAPVAGGKARSGIHPGGAGLPTEHGFRFFPGFYKHIFDTMMRIPVTPTSPTKVYQRLVEAEDITFAYPGQGPIILKASMPLVLTPDGLLLAMYELLGFASTHVSINALLFFVRRVLSFMLSGPQRRLKQYDAISWADFIEADKGNDAYRALLANGLTSSLVAMQPQHGSTLTVGTILTQILLDMLDPSKPAADRVLNAPTSDAWITPWVTYLQSQGGANFNIFYRHEVKSLGYDGGTITHVVVKNLLTNAVSQVGEAADRYILALPLDIVQALLQNDPDGIKTDAGLGLIDQLQTRWMNGVLFYLNREVDPPKGHVLYVGSRWAVTSIQPLQYWSTGSASPVQNDARVKGILSAIISEWEASGETTSAEAKDAPSVAAIVTEVWHELASRREPLLWLWGQAGLHDSDRIDDLTWLDDSISGVGTAAIKNAQPLLVNVVNSHQYRPQAQTAIPNLLLASDYVMTYTDLATMEGANEAGRRAVRSIMEQDNVANPPGVWPMEEPAELAAIRLADDIFFEQWLADNPGTDPATAPEPIWDALRVLGSPHPDSVTISLASIFKP